MPATLTWAARGPYTFTIAGANPTVAEVLAALNTLITANCTMWAVSDYNAGNGTLELKRNTFPSSPTGELATVRMLIFGKSAPHANALMNGASAGSTTTLYAALSVDANTTGPAASYTAGAPYATKYTRAPIVGTPSSFVTATTVKITLYEADDVFGFSIGDSTSMLSCFMGRLIVLSDGSTLGWGVLPSGTTGNYSHSVGGTSVAQSSSHPITPFGQTAGGAKAACWDTAGGGSALQFGRVMGWLNTNVADVGLGASGGAAMLIPVPIVAGAQAAAPSYNFYGTLRQIRFGPAAAHLNKLRDASAVLQGTHVLAHTTQGLGLWLDELP